MKFTLIWSFATIVFSNLAMGQGRPEIRLDSILNAANLSAQPTSGLPYFSRGCIITIFGRNLASKEAFPTSFPLPTELEGTRVRFLDRPGSLLYVSPNQINVVIPDVPRNLSYSIAVSTPAGTAELGQFLPSVFSPGIFTADGSGCGRPALWSYRLNRWLGPDDSLQPGEVATLYGTGFGPPLAPDREAATANPLLTAELPFQIFIASEDPPSLVSAEVLWQGKTPGLAGVDQFNFRVPENAQEGCTVPFRLMKPESSYQVNASQILSIPIARDGGPCRDHARAGSLRLVLVREINSGMPDLPARRDSLWVDFFTTPAPGPPRSQVPPGSCSPFSRQARFIGRVCPGLEGVSGDDLADTTPFDSEHWAEKTPQDAGEITVSAGGRTIALRPGLPNGLPYYPAGLPLGTLEPGLIVVKGQGGAHVGSFEAQIQLPPFAVQNNLAPGTVVGSARGGLQTMRWSGGTEKGVVRWWHIDSECRSYATDGRLGPFPSPSFYGYYGAGETHPMMLLFSPDQSEEVTFTADGLRYEGRLTYLYVYRYGGLRVTQ
jgi:uncharacterized protein (TIGR03437 family)